MSLRSGLSGRVNGRFVESSIDYFVMEVVEPGYEPDLVLKKAEDQVVDFLLRDVKTAWELVKQDIAMTGKLCESSGLAMERAVRGH